MFHISLIILHNYKVFENIILHKLEEYLWTTDNQFGFKSGHSTDLCVYALTEFIEYLKRRSTSVYKNKNKNKNNFISE